MTSNFQSLVYFIWGVADLLRGNFRQSQYGRIILPFTILRRLKCVLESTQPEVLKVAEQHANTPVGTRHQLLLRAAGTPFYNTSKLSLGTLSDRQTLEDLNRYVQSFSSNAREIFDYFKFEEFVDDLNSADLLYQVVTRFANTILNNCLKNHR